MNFWQGRICPVCKKAFTENDDVVCCPQCGTAHHRECWESNKGCAFSEEHAKGNFDCENEVVEPEPQEKADVSGENKKPPVYDENGMAVCPYCGYHNDPMFRICMRCGYEFPASVRENRSSETGAYPDPPGTYHPYGAPPAHSGAEDADQHADGIEVSNEEVLRFFGNLSEKNAELLSSACDGKAAFSPFAFLFSFLWLLYHKVIALGLGIAVAVFSPYLVFYGAMSASCFPALANATSANELMKILNSYIVSNNVFFGICRLISILLLLAAMFVCGFLGMKIYCKNAVKTISEIKRRTFDRQQRAMLIAVRGGVSLFAPVLSFIACSVAAYAAIYIGMLFGK